MAMTDFAILSSECTAAHHGLIFQLGAHTLVWSLNVCVQDRGTQSWFAVLQFGMQAIHADVCRTCCIFSYYVRMSTVLQWSGRKDWVICTLHCILIWIVQGGVEDMDVIFVGCLPIEVDPEKQEVRVQNLSKD